MSWSPYVVGPFVVLAAFLMWLHHYINESDDMKRQNIMAVGIGSLCLLVDLSRGLLRHDRRHAPGDDTIARRSACVRFISRNVHTNNNNNIDNHIMSGGSDDQNSKKASKTTELKWVAILILILAVFGVGGWLFIKAYHPNLVAKTPTARPAVAIDLSKMK